MKVLYVLSCRWIGDTCPIEYTEKTNKEHFEKELLEKGWEKLPEEDGSYRLYFPKSAGESKRQEGFGGHGVILSGVLENGVVRS